MDTMTSPHERGGNSENELYRLVRNENDNEKEGRLIRTGTCSSLKRKRTEIEEK